MKIKQYILMAGLGTRFSNEGFISPKPLIVYNKKPLFWWAAKSSMNLTGSSDITFVYLRETDILFNVKNKILKYFPDSTHVILEHITHGPAETGYNVIKIDNPKTPLAFIDCDLAFDVTTETMGNFRDNESNCGLLTFQSNSSSYSYIKYIDNSIVGAVEKCPVSSDAITGFYYFQSKEIFIDSYLKYLKCCGTNEYYMSGVINQSIVEKYTFEKFDVNNHVSLGTPDELARATDLKLFNRLSWL